MQTALFSGTQPLSQSSFTNVQLPNASWTQPANALDFFLARVRTIGNTVSTCNDAGEAMEITLGLEGIAASVQTHTLAQTSATHVLGLKPPYAGLVQPGTPTAHKLVATARSNCGDAGSWRIQELRVDVVRAFGG